MKSNIGHLEGASGIAGIIKAILVLESAVIPPNANFERLNPNIDAEGLRIAVRRGRPSVRFVNPDKSNSSPKVAHLGQLKACAASPSCHLALAAQTVKRSWTMLATSCL